MTLPRDVDGRFCGSAVHAGCGLDDRAPSSGDGAVTTRRVTAAGVVALVRDGVRGLAWWYSAINGGQDYQRYVTHLRRNHPDQAVPTEREYWRERYAEAERNPSTRCC